MSPRPPDETPATSPAYDILLVDDDPSITELMARILSGLGGLRRATGGASALAQARERPPDLMLLDAEMPEMSGYEVCATMKTDPALRDVPVIFVTAHSATALEVKGFELGAVDFIAKPISKPLLVARVKTQLRIKSLSDELRRVATHDALTGLHNRRSFDESLDREWRRCVRDGEPLSLLMIDVDHFKLFNDRYGHPRGDACLRAVAEALRGAAARPADLVARYGGEEFAAILPKTPGGGAERVAQRVLDGVRGLGLPHEGSPTAPHVTASVGIATYDPACDSSGPRLRQRRGDAGHDEPACTADDLVQCADRALYAAKHAGRARALRHRQPRQGDVSTSMVQADPARVTL